MGGGGGSHGDWRSQRGVLFVRCNTAAPPRLVYCSAFGFSCHVHGLELVSGGDSRYVLELLLFCFIGASLEHRTGLLQWKNLTAGMVTTGGQNLEGRCRVSVIGGSGFRASVLVDNFWITVWAHTAHPLGCLLGFWHWALNG